MTFIERSELEIINNYKPCKDLKTIKNNLFHIVKKAIGDKWFQLTEKTQQMLKKFCLLGNKRGLVFIDPKKLAKEFNVSLVTLNTYLKKLTSSNVIIKLYRRSPKHNGKGAPVYLFTNHPYFPMWADMLGITIDDSTLPPSGPFMPNELLANIKTDFEAENVETPTDSKTEETFFAPNSLELNNNLNNILLNDSLNINVKESKKDTSKKTLFNKIIKYLPNCLQHFRVYFGDNTLDMYKRICRAAKKVNFTDKKSIQNIASIIMTQLKTNIKNGRSYVADELYAYSYKTAMTHFTQHDNNANQVIEHDNNVNQENIEHDNNDNQETSKKGGFIQEHRFIYDQHDNHVDNAPKKQFKRVEMVPNWLKPNNAPVTSKQTHDVSEERKKAIWDQLNKLSAGSI